MNTKLLLAGFTALAWLASSSPALAQGDATAGEAAQREVERAEAERSLAEAQRRLEEVAREVAELSMQVSGPVIEQIRRIRIDGQGRAMLGINVGTAEPGTNGARVVGVSPGGPAAEAGVRAGDLIVAMNGKALASGRDLVSRMREIEPGDTVSLDLKRGDATALKVAVVTRPRDDVMFIGGHPGPFEHHGEDMPPMHRLFAGPFGDAELVPITPGLGRYFGTDRGLLVVHAPETAGSGLEDGDVILAIGGREPQNPGHALRILGSYQPGETVELRVMRQKKERTIGLTVPEASREERRIKMLRAPAPPPQPAPAPLPPG